MTTTEKNVLGEPLQMCSCDPMTGYMRDGFCKRHPTDGGLHLACAVVTDEFLQFSKGKGNDLITPLPQYDFPGLKAGDHWCLCIKRWLEAKEAGVAPLLVLAATHEKVLAYITLEALTPFAYAE